VKTVNVDWPPGRGVGGYDGPRPPTPHPTGPRREVVGRMMDPHIGSADTHAHQGS
jgi:hypothetical protein